MKKFFYKLIWKKKEERPKAYSTGFTLLEMVVAVSILVGAVMGPIVVAVNGINAATGAKNRNLANYLAMEALEVLKNRQYTNYIVNLPSSFAWGITGPYSTPDACVSGKCGVDVWSAGDFVSVCGVDDCKLTIYKPTSTSNEIRYGHSIISGGTGIPNNLNIKRWFQVQKINIDPNQPSKFDQLKVIVTVDWEEKGVPKSVKLEDYLQNWGIII